MSGRQRKRGRRSEEEEEGNRFALEQMESDAP
jgi:hypothetical protein